MQKKSGRAIEGLFLSAFLAVLSVSGNARAQNPCENVTCTGHGVCVVKNGEPFCACHEGYVTDAPGINCLPQEGPSSTTQPPVQDPCAMVACGENSICVVDAGSAVCSCDAGFTPDESGQECVAAGGVIAPEAPAEQPVQRTQPTESAEPPEQTSEPSTAEVEQQEPSTSSQPSDSRAKQFKILGHVGLWSGVAAVGFGVASIFVAKKKADHYLETSDPQAKKDGQTWTGLMWAGFGTGVGLATTGLLLLALGPDEKANTEQSSVFLTPNFNRDSFSLSLVGEW